MSEEKLVELEKFTKHRVGYFNYNTNELLFYSRDFVDVESVKHLI